MVKVSFEKVNLLKKMKAKEACVVWVVELPMSSVWFASLVKCVVFRLLSSVVCVLVCHAAVSALKTEKKRVRFLTLFLMYD
jgi:hypothetical protein